MKGRRGFHHNPLEITKWLLGLVRKQSISSVSPQLNFMVWLKHYICGFKFLCNGSGGFLENLHDAMIQNPINVWGQCRGNAIDYVAKNDQGHIPIFNYDGTCKPYPSPFTTV